MLSRRLKTVSDMVTRGNIVADVGTDHGYVPIYLVKNKISPKVYAMDINKGPLDIAAQNIKMEMLSDRIETIQSDGLEKLPLGVADTVIIAGMGGELIVTILKKSKVNRTLKELILSPHKRADLVRKFIVNNDWHIIEEKMLLEAGKFYVIIKAVPGKEEKIYKTEEYIYGRYLLDEKNKILKSYLEKENNKFESIKELMEKNKSKNIDEIERRLIYNEKGRKKYD